MHITSVGSRPSAKGPTDWFTGAVRIDALFNPHNRDRVQGAYVTFEPGARTAWHTHPLGQTLVVQSGFGRAQRWGGPVKELRPGDVVWFEPGEKHWHGATAITAMSHIAVQEKENGEVEIAAINPLSSIGAIENTSLQSLAREVSEKLQAVIERM
ncbi:MAG: cupin domain-containing protein [Cytophagaceae bacterium]|nr:MAG: cupin domain-containing protein [Cytophagaceae bacterium]